MERPGGTVSVTRTLLAVEGPGFVTVTVKVKLLVTCGELGETTWETPRSAAGPILVVHEAELFAATKSLPTEFVTVAMLVRTPSAAGWTVRVRVAVPLLTIFPNVQVTIPLV